MSTCISCNSYYRLDPFHHDPYNCQDCTAVLVDDYEEDTDAELDILQLVNPNGKIQAVFNETDENDES